MTEGALRRWWRTLWPSGAGAPPPDRGQAAGGRDDDPGEPRREPHRRRYTAPPVDTDPQRESRLGAVLQALAGGPLSRAELGARLDAAQWGPGALDAVVDHGVATHVLVEDAGAVRSRYAD